MKLRRLAACLCVLLFLGGCEVTNSDELYSRNEVESRKGASASSASDLPKPFADR